MAYVIFNLGEEIHIFKDMPDNWPEIPIVEKVKLINQKLSSSDTFKSFSQEEQGRIRQGIIQKLLEKEREIPSAFTQKLAQTQIPERIIAGAYGAGKGLFSIPQIMAGKEATQEAQKIAQKHPIATAIPEFGTTLLSLGIGGGITKPIAGSVASLVREAPTLARFIPQAVQTGTTFASYNLLREAGRQVAEKTFEPKKLISETTEGFITGLGYGGLGQVASTWGRIISTGTFAGTITALENLIKEGKVKPIDVAFNTALVGAFTAINAPQVSREIRNRALNELENAVYNRVINEKPDVDPNVARDFAKKFANAFQVESVKYGGRLPTTRELEEFTEAIIKGAKVASYASKAGVNPETFINKDVIKAVGKAIVPIYEKPPEITFEKPPAPTPSPISTEPIPVGGKIATPEEVAKHKEITEKIGKLEKEFKLPTLYNIVKGKINPQSAKYAGWDLKGLKEYGIGGYFFSPQGRSPDDVAGELISLGTIPPAPENMTPSEWLYELLKQERQGEIVLPEAQQALADFMAEKQRIIEEIEEKFNNIKKEIGNEQQLAQIQADVEKEVNSIPHTKLVETANQEFTSEEDIKHILAELTDEDIKLAQEALDKGLEVPDIIKKALDYLAKPKEIKLPELSEAEVSLIKQGIIPQPVRKRIEDLTGRTLTDEEIIDIVSKKYPTEQKISPEKVESKGIITEEQKTAPKIEVKPEVVSETKPTEPEIQPEPITTKPTEEIKIPEGEWQAITGYPKKGDYVRVEWRGKVYEGTITGDKAVRMRSGFVGMEITTPEGKKQYMPWTSSAQYYVKSQEVKPETTITPQYSQQEFDELTKWLMRNKYMEKEEAEKIALEILTKPENQLSPEALKIHKELTTPSPKELGYVEKIPVEEYLTEGKGKGIIEEGEKEYGQKIAKGIKKDIKEAEGGDLLSTGRGQTDYNIPTRRYWRSLYSFQSPEYPKEWKENPPSEVEFSKYLSSIFEPIGKLSQENSYLVLVGKDGIKQILFLTKGKYRETDPSIAQILGVALNTPDVDSVWFIHNHPSGNLSFSAHDRHFISKISDRLKTNNIKTYGIVIGRGKYSLFDPQTREETPIHIRPYPKTEQIPVQEAYNKLIEKKIVLNHTADIDRKIPPKNAIITIDPTNAVVGLQKTDFSQMTENQIVEEIYKTIERSASDRVIIKADMEGEWKDYEKIKNSVLIVCMEDPSVEFPDIVINNRSFRKDWDEDIKRAKRIGLTIGEETAKYTPTPETPKPSSDDVVKKIRKIIKEARKKRGEIEAKYTEERGKRIAKIKKLRETEPPSEERFYKELSILKGELIPPKEKIITPPIREELTDEEIKALFEAIDKNTDLNDWQKISAQKALTKLLNPVGVETPTASELKLLKKIYGEGLVKDLLEARPILQKLAELGVEILNLPRTILATGDLSAPFRQGLFTISHPGIFAKNFKNMIRVFGSEKNFQELQQWIEKHPLKQWMDEFGLSLTDIDTPLTEREEMFLGEQLAEKIPLFGKVARASNRAYVGFLNKQRVDLFEYLFKYAKSLGYTPEANPEVFSSITRYINSATGRGSMPEDFEKSAVLLSEVLFAPRLIASRFNFLNPVWYMKLHPIARKEALKSLFAVIGAGTTILMLAKMAGAKVGNDPRSADYGKIITGNTRIDVWGGMQQYVRSACQFITGTYISSVTGVPSIVGLGYPEFTRFDITLRFFEQKEAPIMSLISDYLHGETRKGEEFVLWKALRDRMIPMVWQDMYDLVQEDPKLIPIGLLGVFGVGIQTYRLTPNEKEKKLVDALKISGMKEKDINALILAYRRTNALESKFRGLVEQMNQGKLTPQQALEKAQEIERLAYKNVPNSVIPYLGMEEAMKQRGSYLTIKTQAEIDRLKQLPPEQRRGEFTNLLITNPDLAKRIYQTVKRETRETQGERMTNLPVDILKRMPLDQRIFFLKQYLSQIEDEDKKREIVMGLIQVGVINRNFIERMKQLQGGMR